METYIISRRLAERDGGGGGVSPWRWRRGRDPSSRQSENEQPSPWKLKNAPVTRRSVGDDQIFITAQQDFLGAFQTEPSMLA